MAVVQVYDMTKELVVRTPQKAILQASLDIHRSELITIYGRRRIGKTYLIRQYYVSTLCIPFLGLEMAPTRAARKLHNRTTSKLGKIPRRQTQKLVTGL